MSRSTSRLFPSESPCQEHRRHLHRERERRAAIFHPPFTQMNPSGCRKAISREFTPCNGHRILPMPASSSSSTRVGSQEQQGPTLVALIPREQRHQGQRFMSRHRLYDVQPWHDLITCAKLGPGRTRGCRIGSFLWPWELTARSFLSWFASSSTRITSHLCHRRKSAISSPHCQAPFCD